MLFVPIRKITRLSKLDPYRTLVEEKVNLGCTASSIYHFILKKGYKGKETILRDYVRSIKVEARQKATIRFETNPGLQAQGLADWHHCQACRRKHRADCHRLRRERLSLSLFRAQGPLCFTVLGQGLPPCPGSVHGPLSPVPSAAKAVVRPQGG